MPELASLLERCVFPPPGATVDCAVSGGPDSIALLALAAAHGLTVTAVHVDHQLRPDSASDADVVAEAASRFGARFRGEKVEVADGPNLEARAREARRRILGPKVATGHTADDQAETLLMNLLRGSGPSGLAAMSPGHRHPILALRRHETHRLCRTLGLRTVADPANADSRFTRNRVRHELLPLLSDIARRDPVPLLVRAADHARRESAALKRAARDLDPTDTRALASSDGEVARAALREWLRDDLGHPPTVDALERVMAVVRHERIACELPGRRRVWRTDGILHVAPIEEPARR